MHSLAGDELIGHGSMVPRRFLYRGRMLRTGYVEAIAVAPAGAGRGTALRSWGD